MPALKHVHTFERIKGKPDQYRCVHPDCSHINSKELMLGKRAKCICGQEFYLDRYQLKLKNPHCNDCSRSTAVRVDSNISDVITKAMIKIVTDEDSPELELPSDSDPFDYGDASR